MLLKEDNRDLYNTLFNPVKTYAEKKNEWESKHFKVLYPPTYCTIMEDGDVLLQSKKDFRDTNEHEECIISSTKGKERVAFVDKWLKDSLIRRYNYINFLPPPLKCNDDTFNMWNGFYMDKIECEERGDITPILEHMRIMVNRDEYSFNYFIKWCAQLIQQPGQLSGVALVFQSDHGAGKNIFVDFLGAIIGSFAGGCKTPLFGETAQVARDLFGKHSTLRMNKVLVCLNEAKGKDTYESMNLMKDFITEKTMEIEPKG